MDRETKEIKLGEHTFVLKTYATGRETQAIQSVYFKGTKIGISDGTPTFSDLDPSVQFDVQQEMVRQMVVSLDGSTENIVDRVLDLPNEEYVEIIAILDALVSKKNK